MHRPQRRRGRGAHHGTAGAEPPRRAPPRRDAVEVRDPALVGRAHLRAGDGPDGRPPAGPGAAGHDPAHPAQLGRAAGDHPTALRDQQGDEDRVVVREDVDDRPLDDGVLEGAGPAAGCARRRQCCDVGPAPRDDLRQRRSGGAARQRGHARGRDDGDVDVPRRGSPQARERHPRGDGWRGRDAQPTARRPAHPADRHR